MEILEQTKLEKLESICFHFTNKANEESIEKNGLIPHNENDLKAGYDKPKQVYFSKGEEGALSLMNRYLNLLVDKSPTSNKTPIKPEYMNEQRRNDDTPLTENEVFEYMNKLLKDHIYLALDLKEGEDYDSNAINIENGYKVTPRNMNTFENKEILPDKIKKISIDGKTDAISVLTYMYDDYIKKGNKEINTYGLEEKQLVGKFVDYVRNRDNSEISKKEEKEIETNEIGKATINTPTKNKDLAYDNLLNRVQDNREEPR